MALTLETTAAAATTAAATPDKTISINHYNDTNAANTVYYTVPAGRTFKGYVWVNSQGYGLGKFPGHVGGEHYNAGGSTDYPIIPIECLAGDFISGSSNYAYHSVVGIESDA